MDSTDRDDLAALDFSAEADQAAEDDGDPFDFTVDDRVDDDAAVDALDEYAPAGPEAGGSELEALIEDTDDDDDELDPYTCTVTNPAGTVTVSALIDGSIRQIDLSPEVTKMNESQLTEEILVLAHLAQQKGLAGQHSYLMENEFVSNSMRELGLDGGEALRDLMENGMGLPTPAQAAAEEAEVFAARYAGDND